MNRAREAHGLMLDGFTGSQARMQMRLSRQGFHDHVKRLRRLGLITKPDPMPAAMGHYGALNTADGALTLDDGRVRLWSISAKLLRQVAECTMTVQLEARKSSEWAAETWSQTLLRPLSEREVANRLPGQDRRLILQISERLAWLLGVELVLEDTEGRLADGATVR